MKGARAHACSISARPASLLQGHVAGDQVRPEPAAGQVFPVEILRWSPVREADLEAAALRYGLMLDERMSAMLYDSAGRDSDGGGTF